jgi:hypothetical protein
VPTFHSYVFFGEWSFQIFLPFKKLVLLLFVEFQGLNIHCGCHFFICCISGKIFPSVACIFSLFVNFIVIFYLFFWAGDPSQGLRLAK